MHFALFANLSGVYIQKPLRHSLEIGRRRKAAEVAELCQEGAEVNDTCTQNSSAGS